MVGRHGGDSVRKIFESVLTIPDWSKLDTWDAAREIGISLGLKTYASFLYAPKYENSRLETVKRREASIGVAGFRQAWRSTIASSASVRCGDITISLKDGALAFSTAQGQKTHEIPLPQVLKQETAAQQERELATETLTIDLPQGQPTSRLIFIELPSVATRLTFVSPEQTFICWKSSLRALRTNLALSQHAIDCLSR